jgi:hypothetical protein
VRTLSVGGRKPRGNGPGQLSIKDNAKDKCSHGGKRTTAEDMQLLVGLL